MSTEFSKINENKIYLSENLKSLRKYKEITLEQLANTLEINYETFKCYEHENTLPPLQTLIKISNYFEISIDFLLLRENAEYPHNLKLIRLAEKIDKMNQTERYQIESTARTLLKDGSIADDYKNKVDLVSWDLTNNVNDNIKIFFDNKIKTQKEVSDFLGIKASVVSFYKTRTTPPADKLIKLSEIFNISIHALAKGEKLNFNFENKGMEKTILIADYFLTLEHHKFLIELMENILKTNKYSQS